MLRRGACLWEVPTVVISLQGALKVSFTGCHSGKQQLTCTSPKTIWTCQKKFFAEQDWLQFFCNLNFPKNLTCPLGKHPQAPELSDTTFFARYTKKIFAFRIHVGVVTYGRWLIIRGGHTWRFDWQSTIFIIDVIHLLKIYTSMRHKNNYYIFIFQ